MTTIRRALAGVFLAASALAVRAAPVSFDLLPPAEQAALADARTLWPQLPPAERARLQAQARHWAGLDAAGKARLGAALDAWNARPAPERAARRARFAVWSQLPADEQAQVRAAAARFAGMTPAEQQALRQRFAALPAAERERWRLGPGLGPQMAALRGLFDFLPAGEQAALLAAVRGLPLESRVALAQLAPTLSPARAQALRRELLAAPPEGRAAIVTRWASSG
jgi:hypothetical protein